MSTDIKFASKFFFLIGLRLLWAFMHFQLNLLFHKVRVFVIIRYLQYLMWGLSLRIASFFSDTLWNLLTNLLPCHLNLLSITPVTSRSAMLSCPWCLVVCSIVRYWMSSRVCSKVLFEVSAGEGSSLGAMDAFNSILITIKFLPKFIATWLSLIFIF